MCVYGYIYIYKEEIYLYYKNYFLLLIFMKKEYIILN